MLRLKFIHIYARYLLDFFEILFSCFQANLSWHQLKGTVKVISRYSNSLSSTVLNMNGLDFSQHSWTLVNGFETENYVGIRPEKKSFKKSFSFFKNRYGKHNELKKILRWLILNSYTSAVWYPTRFLQQISKIQTVLKQNDFKKQSSSSSVLLT